MWFLCPPGVYRPQGDTCLLEDALQRELLVAADVLDLGTGSGALALAAAEGGAAQVTAVDASVSAVCTTWFNARINGLRVRVLRGDLTGPVAGHRFDLIMANPPYVPSPRADLPARGRARAWDAGSDGRALLDRVCADAPPLLNPGGVLLLVHSGLCGVERTLGRLRRAGLRTVVTERRYIPFGPVLRGRSAWLEARGLIAPGEEKEELVVIRAERQLDPAMKDRACR
ncbi:HemK2/MTQ2 family protein methyltransferase [Actinacidiphila glaucinigra]|uniref:Release factor glutamine methyltransferase n=1 Tax=Actinacidiphila glaucinigra TaxID=235986 RepID=A0A239NM98_9ACTN|nr:HemK2/MTQ2 family protein methyltransferase [Actinacidiphila glaucinigra]SNT55900.1 release factor glutamine methyltransferase [Actinacidiphila glaucinigra]